MYAMLEQAQETSIRKVWPEWLSTLITSKAAPPQLNALAVRKPSTPSSLLSLSLSLSLC